MYFVLRFLITANLQKAHSPLSSGPRADYLPASTHPGESSTAHPSLSRRPHWSRWAPPAPTRWCPPAGGTTRFAPVPSAGPTWKTPACWPYWEPGPAGAAEINWGLPRSLLGQPLLCSPRLIPVFPHFYSTPFFSSLLIQKQTERGKREKRAGHTAWKPTSPALTSSISRPSGDPSFQASIPFAAVKCWLIVGDY